MLCSLSCKALWFPVLLVSCILCSMSKKQRARLYSAPAFCQAPSPVLHTQHTAGSTAVLGLGMIHPILQRGNRSSERFHDLPKVTQPGTVVWLCSALLPGQQAPPHSTQRSWVFPTHHDCPSPPGVSCHTYYWNEPCEYPLMDGPASLSSPLEAGRC